MGQYLDYSKIDIEEILNFYSVGHIRRYGDEINFSCPFPEHPHGDRHPSAYVNQNSGQWHCFSCGRKGSLIKFVADYEEISYAAAQAKVLSGTSNAFKAQSLMADLERAIAEKPRKFDPVLPEAVLSLFEVDWKRVKEAGEDAPKRLKYILDRGFFAETLSKYNVGYDEQSKRLTIPIRNRDGRIVGIKGRATKASDKPKYRPIGDSKKQDKIHYGFPYYKKSKYLWGIDSVVGETVIIVEGELDALWLRQLGFENSVALGGSDPSDKQINTIINRFSFAILLLDTDKAGEKASRKLQKNLLNWIPVRIATLASGDPQENTQKQIQYALDNAQNALTI